MSDRYGRDVLSNDPHRHATPSPTRIPLTAGLVVECADSGFCGAVVAVDKTTSGWAIELADRRGVRRWFPLTPAGFLIDGAPVTLFRPSAPSGTAPVRSRSGSVQVRDAAAQVARASRIWVEGIHDAELLEQVWGHDLQVAGVVVEPLHGADHLLVQLAEFSPGPQRRIGVLLDHTIANSKESRLAAAARTQFEPYIEVAGHPFVDIWQAVKPTALGIKRWPVVPPGRPWKQGVIDALDWQCDEPTAWRRILRTVRTYSDLEPDLLAPVERLIDFVTVDQD